MRRQNRQETLSETAGDSEPTGCSSVQVLREKIESLTDLTSHLLASLEALESVALPLGMPNFGETVDFFAQVREFEILLIKEALKYASGRQVRAAVLLRLPPSTLNHKIKVYKIDCSGWRRYSAETEVAKPHLEISG